MAYKIIDRDLDRCRDWLGDSIGSVGYDMIQAIGLERDGSLVTVTGYNNFTDKACHVHFSMDKGAYAPREYVWFVHHYPFIQARVDVLIAMVSKANHKLIRLVEHLGYSMQCFISGADLLVYSMHKNNCRFLELRHGWK